MGRDLPHGLWSCHCSPRARATGPSASRAQPESQTWDRNAWDRVCKRTNWLFPLIGGNLWRRLTFNCFLHIRKPLQRLENPYLENLIPKHRSEQTSNQWPDGALQYRGHSLGSALGTRERSQRGEQGVGDVWCAVYVCTHTPVR